jgi:hypothetical protein
MEPGIEGEEKSVDLKKKTPRKSTIFLNCLLFVIALVIKKGGTLEALLKPAEEKKGIFIRILFPPLFVEPTKPKATTPVQEEETIDPEVSRP